MTSSVHPVSQSPRSPRRSTIKQGLLDLSLPQLDRLKADTLVLGIFEDVRPLKGAAGFIDWRLCGEVSNLLRNQTFRGEAGELLLISGRGRLPAVRIFLMGWGPVKGGQQQSRARCEQILRMVEQANSEQVAVALPEPCDTLIEETHSMLRTKLGERLEGVFASEGVI